MLRRAKHSRSRGISTLGTTSAASSEKLRLQQELTVSHDLRSVHPDVEIPPHHINMRGRVPLCPSMRPIGIAKRNVYSRIFFVLQDLPNHVLQLDVRADGKFAYTIAVLVRMGVAPEVAFQLAIDGMGLSQPVTLHPNGQRIFPQAAKLRAQPIAHNSIDHKCSVALARSSKHLAARQVAPLVGADDAAGLEPAIFRI